MGAAEPDSSTALGSATWPEITADQPWLLVVPLGATEQHGPHLPLATDTLLARAWSEGVAAAIDGAVVAPALPYGSSGEHQDFAGTLSIGEAALRAVVVELARSAAATFERVAFLSGHAGNARALQGAVDQLRREGHDVVGLVPTWPAERDQPIDAHAGRTETSLLLHLEPDLVRTELQEPGEVRPLPELLDRLMADGVAAVSPNGVLGDPAGAEPGEGRRLLADLVSRTVTRLAAR